MEALTTANAEEALSSWPSRYYTDGLLYYKRCGSVPRNSSMDAEMGGCGMLIDNVQQWLEM